MNKNLTNKIRSVFTKHNALEELVNLIHQEREDAVMGFLRWVYFEKVGGVRINNKIIPYHDLLEQYLKELEDK